MIPVLDGPQPEPALDSFNADKVWYTNLNGSVGQVDPLTAGATAATVAPSPASASPACSSAGSGTAIDVSRRSGTLVWETADYPLLQDQDGWTIYDLPEGAAPWAASGDAVWLNDQGTPGQRAQKLV